jgi:hypothetical protein
MALATSIGKQLNKQPTSHGTGFGKQLNKQPTNEAETKTKNTVLRVANS